MKQTPSALKWLAERRARVAHDVEQTRRIAAELAHRAQQLEGDLAALDHSIRLYDRRVDVEHKGHARGPFRERLAMEGKDLLAFQWAAWKRSSRRCTRAKLFRLKLRLQESSKP